MAEHEFFVGQEISIKGVAHIISAVSPDKITCHYKRGGAATQMSRGSLIRLLESKDASTNLISLSAPPNGAATPFLRDMAENVMTEVEFRHQCVLEVERKAALESRAIGKEEIGKILLQVAQTQRRGAPSIATYYRWRSFFETSGRKIEALADRNKNKGNRSPRLDSEVRHLMALAIDTWLVPHRPTKRWAYSILLGKICELNDFREAHQQLPLPSFNSFCRAIAKLDQIMVTAKRYGKRHADIKYRARAEGPRPTRPLERVEIDHTPLDVIVVNEKGVMLGRPYATVAICAATRAVFSLSISFNPPSYLSVMDCLRQGILPKSCSVNGVQVTKNEWPVYGVPEELICDNGPEFVGRDLELACKSLGINLKFMPRGQPWFKGRVERFLRTLGTGLIHNILGTTKENVNLRGDYKPEKDAVIALPFLKEIVLRWVVDVYMQDAHSSLGTSPAVAWRRAIQNAPIVELSHDIPLDIVLGMNYERTVSNGRVRLNGLQYHSPVLSVLFASGEEDRSVSIKLNPDDIGRVHILHPQDNVYFPAAALDSEYANGLSLYLHKILRAKRRREGQGEVDMRSLNIAKYNLAKDIHRELQVKSKRSKNQHARNEEWAKRMHEEDDLLNSTTRINYKRAKFNSEGEVQRAEECIVKGEEQTKNIDSSAGVSNRFRRAMPSDDVIHTTPEVAERDVGGERGGDNQDDDDGEYLVETLK